jgi:hypothetical protein
VLRRDQAALYEHLAGWELRYATPAHVLEPWDGRSLDPPVHGIWARRPTAPPATWTCEFLLDEARDGSWLYRRNHEVRRPLDDVGGERDGVPFLRPELALLFKSTSLSPKNDADFAAVLPSLSTEACRWLRSALQTCTPGHPWIGPLADELDAAPPGRHSSNR